SSYTLAVADENSRVRVLVTATNPDASASAPSVATVVIPSAPPVDTTAPAISGPAQRTAMLFVSQGTWSGIGNTYAYQWQRSPDGGSTWTDIAGAGGSSYMLTATDEGMLVRASVTASNPDGAAAIGSAPSSPVAPAPPINTVKPTISGLSRLGALLSTVTG